MSTKKYAVLFITLFLGLVLLLGISTNVYAAEDIDVVKITGATLNIKAGEKPVFTATSEQPELYTTVGDVCEQWYDEDTGDYITSNAWYNRDEESLIKTFIEGHTYSYTIGVQAIDPNEDNNFACNFTESTKLSLNGKVYDSVSGYLEEFDEGVNYQIRFLNVLTVKVVADETPATPNETPATPDETPATPEEPTNTLVTDSSSESVAQTTVVAEKELPAGASLSVKSVEIPTTVKTSEKNLKKVFDISVLDTNGAVVEVKDNKMTVTIGLDEDVKGYKYYEVVYIKDGKVVERIPATVKDEKITFTTSHLSEYGIVASNTPLNATKDNSPKTGTVDVISYVSLLAVISLGGIVIASKKIRQ